MKILEVNKCTLPACDCGWNITIGGTSKKELAILEGKKELRTMEKGGNMPRYEGCPCYCHGIGKKYCSTCNGNHGGEEEQVPPEREN